MCLKGQWLGVGRWCVDRGLPVSCGEEHGVEGVTYPVPPYDGSMDIDSQIMPANTPERAIVGRTTNNGLCWFKIQSALVMVAVLVWNALGVGMTPAEASDSSNVPVEDWLYTSIGDFDQEALPLLDRENIAGAQVIFPWKMLEREKDQYDFTQIERVLKILETRHKKMFLQVQDRFFSLPARVPQYLLTEPQYSGGVAITSNEVKGLGEGQPGAVTAQWNPAVRDRFQHLLNALAQRFDGRIAGVNLPETSTQVDPSKDTTGFSCDKYFDATLENMAYGKQVFQKSSFVQYINFWPCEWNNDHRYMERAFEFAQAHRIGLGGPDILPYREAQLENSYPFFTKHKGQLSLVAMAVQEPDFNYVNPRTGKPYTRAEFAEYARETLGASIIFWATSAPWLHDRGHFPATGSPSSQSDA